MEGGVERTVIDEKLAIRLLLQELRDPIGVVGLQLQAAQDENFQRPLEEIEPLVLR